MLNKKNHENFLCSNHLLVTINISGRKNDGLSKRSGIRNIYVKPAVNAATLEILNCFFNRINVSHPDRAVDKNSFIFHALLTLKKRRKILARLKLLTDSKW